jgi:glycosyltransferase involved in cell wall biosynthesis
MGSEIKEIVLMAQESVLMISPFFSPNIGGVETHLDDLVAALDKRGHKVWVHTYSPITTPGVKWAGKELRGRTAVIRRYAWFGKKLFHKLEKLPFFDFLYITPYLFFRILIWLLFHHREVDVLHAHGLNGAWMGTVYKKIFHKRLIVSTHAIYELDKNSSTAKRAASILNLSDKVIATSMGSYRELESFGVRKELLGSFKYWVDLEIFKPADKTAMRKELGFRENFTVLFVGRLIEKKGIKVLAEAAADLPEIDFVFIGAGPEENYLTQAQHAHPNIRFAGKVSNNQLYRYYNIADVFCIPSQYEEAYGRVVIEAAACGLPVVASNKGGIPEALDSTVAILINPDVDNIRLSIQKLYQDKDLFNRMKEATVPYARKNFSEDNVEMITRYYR